jgi:formylmethanofuran dehydrogenase subunit E
MTVRGHLCAGRIPGVRMALLRLELLGIADPRGADRKRVVTFVEIDRDTTDAYQAGDRLPLGKRALKFRDWDVGRSPVCGVKHSGERR